MLLYWGKGASAKHCKRVPRSLVVARVSTPSSSGLGIPLAVKSGKLRPATDSLTQWSADEARESTWTV